MSLAQQDKVDLVAWKDDEYLRIQVKTSKKYANDGRRSARYHFQLGSGCKTKTLPDEKDYDILCCVGYDHRKALFLPVQQVQQKTKSLSPQLFDDPKAELHSFNKALATIYKNKNKQPLTQSDINSAASNFIYRPVQRNIQRVSGSGVMGGNDYGS